MPVKFTVVNIGEPVTLIDLAYGAIFTTESFPDRFFINTWPEEIGERPIDDKSFIFVCMLTSEGKFMPADFSPTTIVQPINLIME
jgi:hypothetical protein